MIFRAILFCLIFGFGIALPETSMAQLEALDERIQEQKEERTALIRKFVRNRGQQEKILQELRDEYQAMDARLPELEQQFSSNEERIKALKSERDAFAELSGYSKTVAGELHASLKNSVTSAENPVKLLFLADFQRRDGIPSLSYYQRLSEILLHEIRLQREFKKFVAKIDRDGETVVEEVYRVGAFSAFDSDGRFLIYMPEAAANDGPPFRQVLWQHAEDSQKLQRVIAGVKGDVVYVPIDPTRGSLINAAYGKPRPKPEKPQSFWQMMWRLASITNTAGD